MKSIYTILILSFLATFGIADEITGLNLRTGSVNQVVNPTAVAGAVLSLDANKRPTFGGPLTFSAAGVATFAPTALSGSQATSALDISQTWNTSGTPTALKLNVTDTASNASSRLLDLQVGGTSVYNRDKNGYHRKYDFNNAVTWPLFSGGAFGNDTTVSMYQSGGVNYAFRIGSTYSMALVVNDPGILVYEKMCLGPSGSGPDIWIGRESAATLQLGTDHATTPTAQTIKAHDVTTGTGASLTLTGGKGSVAGGSVVLATSATNGAPIPRNYVSPKEVTLTDATDTTVVNIAIAAGKYLGGELIVTTHADDGTDFQAITEHLTFSAVNKTGTVTATIQTTPSTSFTAASAGTLTTGWSIVVNGDSVDIKNNATSSLDETTLKCSYQLRLNTDGAGTVTP